jgi:hypothetical protein
VRWASWGSAAELRGDATAGILGGGATGCEALLLQQGEGGGVAVEAAAPPFAPGAEAEMERWNRQRLPFPAAAEVGAAAAVAGTTATHRWELGTAAALGEEDGSRLCTRERR